MKTTRRGFLQAGAAGLGALWMSGGLGAAVKTPVAAKFPRVVSTWDFGVGANAAAWKVLGQGGSALDAV